MLRTSSTTGSSENSTLAVEDDEVDCSGSGVPKGNRLSPVIQGSSKIVSPLTLMLIMSPATRSSEVSTPRAFGVDDDEVVGGGSGGSIRRSSKSRNPANLSQSTLQV